MYAYPLLQEIYDLYSRRAVRDLENVHVIACQHILEPQKKMFDFFVKFGIRKENMRILGKAYSTSSPVFDEFVSAGFQMERQEFEPSRPFDDVHRESCAKLMRDTIACVPQGGRIIVLDDGGYLLSAFNDSFDSWKGKFKIFGIEQTSSGFRLLERVQLHFPVINVARSPVKLNQESVFIAQNIREKLAQILSSLPSSKVLVVGLGPIGRSLKALLEKQGFKVAGFDVSLGHKDLISQIKELHPSLIVGASGTKIMSEEDIRTIGNFDRITYLASVSSSDREFPVIPFRNSEDIHSSISVGNARILNNGFPVTFWGNRNEIEPEKIEPTIAQLLGSVLSVAGENSSKAAANFIDVPREIITILGA